MNDVINHPSHYETGKFECFDWTVKMKTKIYTQAEVNKIKVDEQFKSINENYNTLDELIQAVYGDYGILFE